MSPCQAEGKGQLESQLSPYSCLKCEQKLNLNHKLNKRFRNQKRSLNTKCNRWPAACSILYRAPREVEFLHHLAYFLLFPISLTAIMKILSSSSIFIILLIFVSGFIQAKARVPLFYCGTPGTRCYNRYILCPFECPSNYSHNTKEKVCYADCNSPHCKAQCKHRKPNCEAPGSTCYDPHFIGGDGIVFYFHEKSNEQFSLVSNFDLQINSRFIGHRPTGRPRDFTWIQALGVLYNSQTFSGVLFSIRFCVCGV